MRNLILLLLVFSSVAFSHDWRSARADAHAPIGVMGDHLHRKGEVMFSYRYMTMEMEGNRIGSNRVSQSEAFAAIPGMGAMSMKALPRDMNMAMHMVGMMYAPSDQITLMGMLNYLENDMTVDRQMNGGMMQDRIKTASSGVGDIKLAAMISLFHAGSYKAHVNLGVNVPTGSIDEKQTIPGMGMNPSNEFQLPYPMQLGSGSLGFLPSVTFLAQYDNFSWGAQIGIETQLEKNDQNYRLGRKDWLTAWVAKPVNDALSVSLRLEQRWWDDIRGQTNSTQAMSHMMAPAANPGLRGGERLDAGLGLNVLLSSGHRLAVEYLQPLKQDLDGPQLEIDSQLVVGWQYAM